MSEKTTESFQTEVSELLQLIIHSLYSHPEIFLRELISNASDALDKLKLEALTDESLLTAGYEAHIRLTPDKAAKTLTISDNGIGMTIEEARENLGRIAHSGTKEFAKKAKQLEQNPDLIGQFGVGFYSAFMVAKKVVVETQRAGSTEGARWESDGKGSFSIEPFTRPEGNGTSITLYLMEQPEGENELADFSEEWVLRETVKKHSDFIAYPIKMAISREKPVSEEEGAAKETVIEDAVLNSQKALWLRSASEVTAEEYEEFYRHLTHDYAKPLKTIHYRAEGTTEFSALLFMPEARPWNYDYESFDKGLSLYIRRVLVKSRAEELLPAYLKFVRGVVDCSDLPLNVSREMLQHDRQISQIQRAVTTKILRTLAELRDKDRETYEKFWTNFGATLKEGIVRAPEKKDDIMPLILANSSASDKLTTLAEYVSRMKEGQPAIYFASGDSLEHLKHTPLLEKLRSKGYEVLFFAHPIDEIVSERFEEFDGKPMQSIASSDLTLDTEEEKQAAEEALKAKTASLGSLIEIVKSSLSEQVSEVRLSSRLTDSPACLVSDGDATSRHMEAFYRQMGKEPPKVKRVLEVNPDHPVISRMAILPEDHQRDWSELLYNQAIIAEGGRVENPAEFSKKLTKLMLGGAS